MEFLKGIEETDETPSVPEKIRRFIQKNLYGMTSISIKEQKTDAKKFKQLNKLTLRNKKGEIPDEDVEEICVGIMLVIEKRDFEREEGDPLINFQILATVHGKTGSPKNPSVEYEFSPDGSYEDGGFGGDDYDNPLRTILDAQTNYISTLHFHLDESHTVIRDIANNNQQGMKPLMEALGYMGHFYASGLQNQQQAFAMMYDIKRVEAEERGKSQRTDKWMEMLKTPLGAMGEQILPWAMAKMSGKKFVPPKPEDIDEEDEDEGEPIENIEADLGLTEDQKNNPVAAIASALATTIEANQWFEISDLLKKKEIRLMRAVMTSETDEECASAYSVFSEIPVAKLLGLNKILSEDQREMLNQLGQLVKAVKDGTLE